MKLYLYKILFTFRDDTWEVIIRARNYDHAMEIADEEYPTAFALTRIYK